MRSSSVFWGLFFITLGAVFVIEKYTGIYLDWYLINDLWPFILVFWGLAVMFRDSKIKPIFGGAAGITLAFIVYSFFLIIFTTADIDFADSEYGNHRSTSVYNESYDSSIEYANLKISGGFGKFTVYGFTDDLILAKARGMFSDYKFYSDADDNTVDIHLEQEDDNFNLFEDSFTNHLNVKLNNNPIWKIELNNGAAANYLDLSDYKLSELELNTGATKTRLKIGDKFNKTDINIEMGAASLEIDIPKDSGCEVYGDLVMIAKNLEGFSRSNRNDKYYYTANFDTTKNKIYIKIDGGISSLDINRY